MTRTLRPAVQVVDYARRLAPEPRRAVKLALRELANEKGDIRALEGTLVGYYRLRVGRHRIIFNYAEDGAIEAVFIEERSVVYEIFEAEFIKKLRQ
jgi:mRNA interferase RelE/StbE